MFIDRLTNKLQIDENWQVDYRQALKQNYRASEHKKDVIMLHYTDTVLTSSVVAGFTKTVTKTSAHFLVERDGHIIQFLPANQVAYHAGNWDMNLRSIGVELANVGVSKFGKYVPECDTMLAKYPRTNTVSAWEKFRDEQLAALVQLLNALVDVYPISTIIGHDQVPKLGRIDPGPAFPWSLVLEEVQKKRPIEHTYPKS